MTALETERRPEQIPRIQPRPRRRLWLLVALLVGAMASVGLGTWLVMNQITVSNDEYDDVVARLDQAETDLDSSQEAAVALEADLAGVRADLTRTSDELAAAQEEITALTDANATLQGRFDTVTQAASEPIARIQDVAAAMLLGELWFEDDFLAELKAEGFDPAVGDELLQRTGSRWQTIDEYAGSFALPAWGSALSDLADPAIDLAFDAYVETPSGSLEETGALLELRFHLWRALFESLDGAGAAIAR